MQLTREKELVHLTIWFLQLQNPNYCWAAKPFLGSVWFLNVENHRWTHPMSVLGNSIIHWLASCNATVKSISLDQRRQIQVTDLQTDLFKLRINFFLIFYIYLWSQTRNFQSDAYQVPLCHMENFVERQTFCWWFFSKELKLFLKAEPCRNAS